MKKVIAIFGAGSGLASSVARQYGTKGHAVALVARNPDGLKKLADHLGADGIEMATFAADLSRSDAAETTVAAIRERFGRIDAIYYAPNAQDAFTPATRLTPDILQPLIDLYFYGLVNVVNAALPELRERDQGSILAAFGGSAQAGFPFMSGIGTAMAAARNYLQSLHQELLAENINVGVVTITAVIQNSAYHRDLQADNGKIDLPNDVTFPEADPDHLAVLLDEVLNDQKRLEAVYPPA